MSKYRVGDRVMMIGTINAVGDGAIDGFYGVEVAGEGVVGYREESLSPAPPTPTGKTVKARMAILVGPEDEWVAQGASRQSDADAEREVREWTGEYQPSGWRLSFVEADVPAPDVHEPETILGTVEPSDG